MIVTGGGGIAPSHDFLKFLTRRLSGHLSISVPFCLSLGHIYCEFGENQTVDVADI